MSFSADDLQQLVGRAVFRRGEEYFRGGAVSDVALDGNSITAVVYGGDVYDVSIWDLNSAPRFYCPCPYRARPACKHVVAVWLAWEALDGGHSEDDADDDLDDLDDWAERHQVSDLLDRPAVLLNPHVLRLGRPRTVREVLDGSRTGADGVTRSLVQELFVEVAEQRAAALTLEAERIDARREPDDPALVNAWVALRKLREIIRKGAIPLYTGVLNGLRLKPDPPTLLYPADRPAWVCSGPPARVVLAEDGRSPIVRCGCPEPNSRCPVALTAIDAALDFLEGYEPLLNDEREDLAEILRVPEWERFLAAVDEVIDDSPRPVLVKGKPAQLGWIVRKVGSVEPVLFRKKKSANEYIHQKPSGTRIQQLHALCATAAERQALDTVASGGYSALSVGARARVLKALAHRASVFDARMRPIEVVPTHIRLAVNDTEAPSAADESGKNTQRFTFLLGELEFSADTVQSWGRTGDSHVIKLDEELGRCFVADLPAQLTRLAGLLFERGQSLKPQAVEQLLNRLSAPHVRFVGLQLGARLRGGEVAPDATPQVRLALDGRGGLLVHLRVRAIPERGLMEPGDGDETLFGIRNGQRVFTTRDFQAELHQARRVVENTELDVLPPLDRWNWRLENVQRALILIRQFECYDAPLIVEWDSERRLNLGGTLDSSGLDIGVKRQGDWFSITGSARAGKDRLPLAEVLDLIREHRRFVQISGDEWVELGETLRDDLSQVSMLANKRGEIPVIAAPALDALAAAGHHIDGDDWLIPSQRLAEANALDPSPPETLQATLRSYQDAGYRWLRRLAHWSPGAVLADDMGLGKTVQALALLLDRASIGPTLVVAPTSLGVNWQREAARFAPSLRMRPFRGQHQLEALESLTVGTVVVTSYDLVVRHRTRLEKISWGTLVLDEAQAIKNPGTQRARAVFALNRGFTLALTGTPIENRASELWSLFKAVAPGYLGSGEQFRERFIRPLESGDKQAREVLSATIRPFVLRRLKSEVARDLPPREDVRIDVELSDKERGLYEQLRTAVVTELDPQNKVESVESRDRRFQVLAALTHLRRLACDPSLVYPETRVLSSKLAVLREQLTELVSEGHRALVFSQFTTLLARVKEILDGESIGYEYLDGSTSQKARMDAVDAFQAGRSPVFLLSLKAGGTGLNLTAADYVIHLDPWWNPAIEDQATDRAHRIGQDKPVTVYRLVALGTVEETIYDLHHKKRRLVSAVLEGTDTPTPLTTDELLGLLAG